MSAFDEASHRAKFDLPRERIVPLEGIDLVAVEGAHPYERQHEAEIEALWQTMTAEKPALFDGKFCLMESLKLSADGVLRGTFHLGRYATFLHWRANRGPGLEHIFAHAVPVLADGALLAVAMGETTLNAGQVYFAAGSFDADDVFDGKIDLEANMYREVEEETGLDIRACDREDALWLWSGADGASCLFRRFHLPQDAGEAERAVRRHIAAEAHPELASPIVLRSVNDLPPSAPDHMRPFLDFHFGQSSASDTKKGVRS
ncbi:hypothetical protein [Notoacmeibacter ruber]|uniref:hypothetical protein n=1 Tax=Notoacmeibacter ruber TaxID=2670375 RepID=UPI00131432A6|nr:hypothetical protein [Notoacmeibacter ruber]